MSQYNQSKFTISGFRRLSAGFRIGWQHFREFGSFVSPGQFSCVRQVIVHSLEEIPSRVKKWELPIVFPGSNKSLTSHSTLSKHHLSRSSPLPTYSTLRIRWWVETWHVQAMEMYVAMVAVWGCTCQSRAGNLGSKHTTWRKKEIICTSAECQKFQPYVHKWVDRSCF